MRRIAIAFGLLLLATIQAAAWGSMGAGGTANLLNPQVLPPAGSPGLPAVDDNLAAGNAAGVSFGICAEYGHQVPCTLHYSITRASVKYCAGVSGVWRQALSGQACMSNQGQLIEEARTNNGLWARDMTQAAWVPVNMTAALNAVGIDGTSNSATTLTATAGNGSILQTLVLGSAAENYSVWLKRVTGSGTVNITLNNLVGTTACTVTSTTDFTRCTVTATLANPVIGIQIVTSGDVVIADFNQLEAGVFPTSPILTTTVAVARALDSITAINNLLSTIGSATVSIVVATGSTFSSAPVRILVNGSTSVKTIMAFSAGSTNNLRSYNGVTILDATLGSGSSLTATKSAIGFSPAGRSLVANNGTLVTDAATFTASASVYIGALSDGTVPLNGYMQRLSAFNSRIPDTTLKALTAP